MSRMVLIFSALISAVTLPTSLGQEYGVESIDAPPKVDEISEDLLSQFRDKGYLIKRGSRTVCEIWLCKEWKIDSDFKPSAQRLYPFAPGELVGLLHFSRRGSDFRDQSIDSGWYTLRFGLQPVDGNHVGTSPTQDFLLMVAAADDEVGKEWDFDELMEASAEAAGTSHPAMICLQRTSADAALGVRHDEANDWWILHAVGKGSTAGKLQDVAIDLIVAGHAAE